MAVGGGCEMKLKGENYDFIFKYAQFEALTASSCDMWL